MKIKIKNTYNIIQERIYKDEIDISSELRQYLEDAFLGADDITSMDIEKAIIDYIFIQSNPIKIFNDDHAELIKDDYVGEVENIEEILEEFKYLLSNSQIKPSTTYKYCPHCGVKINSYE